MASITKRPNGRREIQFIGIDNKRRTLRLGKVDQKIAESIRLRVEELNSAKVNSSPIPLYTALWLQSISDGLHDRLQRCGLCEPRTVAAPTELPLHKMLSDYIARRDDVKAGTRTIYEQAARHLKLFFGNDRSIKSITIGEAGDYRRSLRKQFSEAYTAKMIIKARTFWRDAVDRKLCEVNIFSKVTVGSQVNTARQRFIERAVIDKVIDVCPDIQWKLLLALSRYAGLRCPSEHLALRWADVDFAAGRMTVHAIKTEHHADKGIRVVPIFSELRPYLQVVFDQREEGAEFVITRYRQANANLRTQFLRYIRKAGVTPWPKLFHNLRASCQTELAERFPSHVICQWIGNSEAVAREHYLQTTDAHFARAVSTRGETPELPAKKSDAESDAATSGVVSQATAPVDHFMLKIREILHLAKGCDPVQIKKWALQGSNL